MPTFKVSRTSDWCGSRPPVPAAILIGQNPNPSFPQQFWMIEVNSLEELLSLVDSHGELIISPAYPEDDQDYRLEVYDGYRE